MVLQIFVPRRPKHLFLSKQGKALVGIILYVQSIQHETFPESFGGFNNIYFHLSSEGLIEYLSKIPSTHLQIES